jgi:SAM-dependent methyltransferase
MRTSANERAQLATSSISQAEIEARISGHLDELLELWSAEQGVSKPRDLQLIASALPFPRGQAVLVLDLCCGPGDVGRAIRQEYPHAQIHSVDRDPFLTSICTAVNRRDQVPSKVVVADLRVHGWQGGLSRDYDAVVAANALHWFDVPRAEQLAQDIHALLRTGGVFVFAEPASRGSGCGWVRGVEGQATSAIPARELGTILVDG